MNKAPIGIERIRELLPHRYTMLMIDRVIELSEQHVLAEKLISASEPSFAGHFPDQPIFPGVLQIEALAQLGGVFVLSKVPDPVNWSTFLLKIDNTKFKQKVGPG